MTMNDLESPHLFRLADALGWQGSTEVDLMCDVENMRIIIDLNKKTCIGCGQSMLVEGIPLGSKLICEKCVSIAHHRLKQRYRKPDAHN